MSCILIGLYSNIHLPLPVVRNAAVTTNLRALSTRNQSNLQVVSHYANNTTFQPATSMEMLDIKQLTTSSAQNWSMNSSVTELPNNVKSSRKDLNQSSHSVIKQRFGLILMWDYQWDVKDEGPEEGKKIGRCVVTYKRELLEKADAVIFPYMNAPIRWPHYR